MKKGDSIKTPRFLTVKIYKVFKSRQTAIKYGFVESTHYKDAAGYLIYGKMIGHNLMKFAAVKPE